MNSSLGVACMRIRVLSILFLLVVFFAPGATSWAELPGVTSSRPATIPQPSIPSDPRRRENPLIVPSVF